MGIMGKLPLIIYSQITVQRMRMMTAPYYTITDHCTEDEPSLTPALECSYSTPRGGGHMERSV